MDKKRISEGAVNNNTGTGKNTLGFSCLCIQVVFLENSEAFFMKFSF